MGKGMSPTKGYNYKNWNANFDGITWSETKTIEEWVECLALEKDIIDWDFTSPRDERISLKEFLKQTQRCTTRLGKLHKIYEFFDKDPDFVTCAECGQPRKWNKLKEMRLENGYFVCQNCNYN